MLRANSSTCHGCDAARNTTSLPARFSCIKKSLSITAGIVSKNVRLVVLVMACSRASLAPFVCVRHLMSCCEHVAFWHCRAAMLHRTLVIPSPLSYMSPRCNPGLHRLRSLVTFMLEECQVVIAAIIRSSGASSKWLAFAFFFFEKSWNKCEAFS